MKLHRIFFTSTLVLLAALIVSVLISWLIISQLNHRKFADEQNSRFERVFDRYRDDIVANLITGNHELLGETIDSIVRFEKVNISLTSPKVQFTHANNSIKSEDVTRIFPLEYGGKAYGQLTMRSSMSSSDEASNVLFIFFLGQLVVGSFGVGFFFYYNRRFLLRPLNELVNQALNDESALTLHSLTDAPSEIYEIGRRLQILVSRNKEASRREAYIELAAQVAHDIRSPVSALNAVFHLAHNIPEEHRKLVQSATQRISLIAENLLKKYRDKDGGPSLLPRNGSSLIVSLEQLVNEKKFEFLDQGNVEFCLTSDEGPHEVEMNHLDLSRIISNLINNAVEAAAPERKLVVKLSVERVGREILVRICDNGVGMGPEVLAKVGKFKFSYGKKNGNGLGIAQAAATLLKNKARIEIDSKLGDGTTITLTLPALDVRPLRVSEI